MEAARKPMTDSEVEQYLQYILATTLVLDDGTRVKPIFLEWNELTPPQRTRTVQAIKDAAIDELKSLRNDERLRLEFNRIPGELEEALSEIVSPHEPNVEWVQVEE
jgi:hypothetical protein